MAPNMERHMAGSSRTRLLLFLLTTTLGEKYLYRPLASVKKTSGSLILYITVFPSFGGGYFQEDAVHQHEKT